MEQVSPEVKEAYLNNLTYTTINKKDWKALNGKYNVDNARDKQIIFSNSLVVLAGIIIIASVISAMILYNPSITLFALFSFVPVITMFVETKFDLVYNMIKKKDMLLYRYRHANDSFYVLIEGNDKHRYYSRWYLELINPKVKATSKIYENKYVRFNEAKTERTRSYYSNIHDLVLFPVTRHHDRFNWRNTLSTNRVLSIEEYKDLIKSKEEFKKYMEMEEDIREFQKYNGL